METSPADQGHLADRLDVATMAALVDDFFLTADARPWNRFSAFDWQRIDTDRLAHEQRSAVAFITVIEDHLPGYFAEYQRLFPVDDTVPLAEYLHNREFYRFAARWAQEEDTHAHVLFLYQVKSGLASADHLRRELGVEGQKRFALDHRHPVQVFTYTLLQEKATQLYYQQFAHMVEEPVLQSILLHLARDEARHFAFFAKVMEAYLHRFGAQLLPAMKEVLQGFKMPLATTLRNYWRWSLKIANAAGGYDHAAAYEALIRVVKRSADAPTWSKAQDLVNFVRAVRAL